jgi:hypothetical protein
MQGRLLSRKQVREHKLEETDLYAEGYGTDN